VVDRRALEPVDQGTAERWPFLAQRAERLRYLSRRGEILFDQRCEPRCLLIGDLDGPRQASPPDLRLRLAHRIGSGRGDGPSGGGAARRAFCATPVRSAPAAESGPDILDGLFRDGKQRALPPVADGGATSPEVVTADALGPVAPSLWLFPGSDLALLVSLGNEYIFEYIQLNWWAVLGLNQ
jgi:hypothetical protein